MTVAVNDRVRVVQTTAGQPYVETDFRVDLKEYLVVYRVRDDEREQLVLDVDYTVSQLGDDDGCRVTFTPDPAEEDDTYVLLGALPVARTSSFVERGGVSAASLDEELDAFTHQMQEMKRDTDRAFKTDILDPGGAFDLEGRRLSNVGAPEAPGDAVTLGSIQAVLDAAAEEAAEDAAAAATATAVAAAGAASASAATATGAAGTASAAAGAATAAQGSSEAAQAAAELAAAAAESNVETALNALNDHLGDATDAHDASAISFDPVGSIAATDVQAAIASLDLRFSRIVTVYPKFHGVVGDGVADDTAAIQVAVDYARTLADPLRHGNDLYGTRVVVDFTGLKCLTTEEIVCNDHGYITLLHPSLVASASWAGADTDYMLNCVGTSLSNAHLQIINPVLDCKKKCNGIHFSHAPRGKIWNPVITHMKTRGLTIGASVWLAEFSGRGAIHEYDSGDTELNDTTPGVRTATGVYIDTNAGDFVLDLSIGFIKTCVDNHGIGVIQLAGHWYCSAPGAAIDGEIYIHNNTGSVTIIDECYLDTGRITYKGGHLHFGDGCAFFVNVPVQPVALDAYIHLEAPSAGAYSLLTMGNVRFALDSLPVFKDTSSGGNSWANVQAGSLTAGNKCPIITNQEMILACNADTANPLRILGRKSGSGAFMAFEAPATTWAPQIGVEGNNLSGYAEGVRKFRILPAAAGGVLLENRCSTFHAYHANSVTGIADATFTTVTWDTEEFDVGSNFASGAWTPPAGLVHLHAVARLQGTIASAATGAIRIRKNGTVIASGNSFDASTGDRCMEVSRYDIANGTDVYDVQVFLDVSSGTVTLQTGSPAGTASYFEGRWCGSTT